MKHRRRHFHLTARLAGVFCACVFANTANASAQEATPPWYSQRDAQLQWIDRRSGLSHNSVFDILQDHQGYLWIGTGDGLNRYDGRAFEIFRHDADDAGSLSNSTIREPDQRTLEDP